MRITVVTVVGGYDGILGHMLRHYASLGVDAFSVHVHVTDRDDAFVERVCHTARENGCDVDSVTIGDWTRAVNPAIYRAVRSMAPDEWFLLADQDELHHYPDDLRSILEFCERHGYDYVEGAFVDRIAENGGFPPVDHGVALPAQFPLGGFVSLPLLNAAPWKVTAMKGYVEVGQGQHTATNGTGCPIEDCFVQVHHFKWVEGLVARLQERVNLRLRLGEPYWQESARFIRYFHEHGGRLDLGDPLFRIARCDPSYPYWSEIRQFLATVRSTGELAERAWRQYQRARTGS